jgi:uncharacterized protein YndB with AHSA1/START domain
VIVDGCVVHERRYSHSIERVWHAFTDRAELATWLMANDANQSGDGFRFDGGERLGVVDARVIERSPPHRLVWEWTFHGQRSRVTVELTETDGATRLRLEHQMLDPGDAIGFDAGWADKLDGDLAALLADDRRAADTYQRSGMTFHPHFDGLASAMEDGQ